MWKPIYMYGFRLLIDEKEFETRSLLMINEYDEKEWCAYLEPNYGNLTLLINNNVSVNFNACLDDLESSKGIFENKRYR